MIPGQDVTLHIKFIPSDAPYKLNNIVIESTSCGAVLTKGKDSIFVGDKLYRSSGKIMATTNCIYTIMGNKVEQYSPRGKYSEALSKVHQSSKLEHPLASSVIDFELITCANNGLYYTIGNDVYHLKSLKSATTKVTSSPRKILKLYGHENAIYAVTEAESEDNFDISVYDCKSEKLFYFQDLLFKDGDANDIIFCGIQSESIIGIIGLLQEYIYIGRSNGEIINIELQEDSDKIYFDGIPKAIWTEGDLIVIKGENSCARFKLEGIQKENLDADLELLEFVRKCQNIFDEEGEDEGFELVEDSADVASPKSDRETSIVAETDKSVVNDEIGGVDCDNTLKLEDLEIHSEKSTNTENQILIIKEKTNHGLEDEQQEAQSINGEVPALEKLEGTPKKTISTGDMENGETSVSKDSSKPFSFLTTVSKELKSAEKATSTGNSIEMSESEDKESSAIPTDSKNAFSFLGGPTESPNPLSNPFNAASNQTSAFDKASGFGTSAFAISAKAIVTPFGAVSVANRADSNPISSFAASPFAIAEMSTINPFGAGTDLKKIGDSETSAGSGGSTTFSFLKPNIDSSGSFVFTKPKPELGLFRNTESTTAESEASDSSSDSESDSSADPDGFEEYLKQPIQPSSIGTIVAEAGPQEDSTELGKIESITLNKDQSANSAGEKKDEKVELQPKDSVNSVEDKLTFSFASNSGLTTINQKVSIESTSSSSNSASNSAVRQNNLFSSPNSQPTEITAKNGANPFFKLAEPKVEAVKSTEVKLDTQAPGTTTTSGTGGALGMQGKTTNQFSSFTNAPSIFSVNVKSSQNPTPAAGISLAGTPRKQEEAIAPKSSPFTIPLQTPKTDLNGDFPTISISSTSFGAKAPPKVDISNSKSDVAKSKESSKTVLESSPFVNTQPDIPYEIKEKIELITNSNDEVGKIVSKTSHELSSQLNSIKARVVQLKTHAQNDFSETKSNLILTNDVDMKKIECIKRLDAIQGKGRLDSDLASKISPEASTMRQILLFKKSQLEGQLEFCMTKLDLEGRRKNTSKLLGIYNTAKRLRKVIRGTAIALEKSSATLDAARTKLGVAKKPETALGRNRFGLSEEDRYCDDLLPPKCESHYKEDFLKRMKLQLMFKESKIVTQIIKNEPNQSVSNTLASVAMKMSAATSDSAAKSNQIEKPSNSVIETQHINFSEPINKIPGWKCKICTNTNNSKSQTCSICGMALNPPVDSIPNKGRSVSLPLKQNPTPIKVAALQSVSVPLASMPPKASDFEIETPAATSTSKRESVEKLLPSPKVKPSKPDATEHKSKSETMSQEPSKPDATAHKAKSETKSPVPSISDAKDQESKLETKSQESKTEEKTETFSFKGFGTTLKESKTNLESGKSTAITVPQTLHTVPNAVDSKSVDDDMQDDGVPIAADNGPPAPGKPSSTSGPFESTTAVSTSNPWGNPATQLSSAFGAQNATSTSSATQSVTTSAFGMQSAPSNSFGAASNIGQSTAATGWGTSAATSQTSSPWGKTSLFGTSGVASAFGSQSASTSLGNQQAVSAFGTKTNSSFSTPPSATKASAFGNQQVSSAFGTQSSVASAFGTPTTTSAFATNPGSSSTPAFGASAFGTQSSASAFGTQSTTSAFGGSSSTPAWGKKDNPFGGGTQMAVPAAAVSTSSFAKYSGSTGGFGTNSANQPQSQSSFGGFGQAVQATSAFGQSSQPSTAFGTFGQQNPSTSAFGSSTQTSAFGALTQTKSAFGSSPFGTSSAFGNNPSFTQHRG